MRKNLLILFLSTTLGAYAQSLQAAFSAAEAKVAYYTMGWDSEAEFDTWTYTEEGESGWEMGATPYTSGAVTFDKIDPSSLSSLLLHYGYQQNATATSPEITVKPESSVEFYSFASGIFLYSGAWKFYVVDSEDNATLLLDQFLWAQEKGYDGPSWELFSVDLAEYAGQTVRFRFVYEGTYGEDEAIDGFKVCQTATDESAKINVKVGTSVHFTDMTVADADADLQWSWTFEGGSPASSTERNPVVTYGEEGVFSVTLSVSDNNGNVSSATRTGYVIVTAEAPVAKIGIPDGAYLSPWVMMFVPVDVPLTFRDLSTGFPNEWLWHFYGTDIATSTLQHPTVTYTEAGTYGLRIDVANNAGSSTDSLINTAIQAGGEQYIWNIAPEENGALSIIEMG